MPFCAHCGTAAEGAFCPSCGKPVAGGGGAAPPPAAAAGGMADNVAGALCYLAGFITGILFLVLEPYNRKREIRFHAFQSIFLNVACIGLWIVLSLLMLVLSAIPFIGWVLAFLLPVVLSLGFLALWIMLLVKTFNGQKWVLPFIGPLAEKQAG